VNTHFALTLRTSDAAKKKVKSTKIKNKNPNKTNKQKTAKVV